MSFVGLRHAAKRELISQDVDGLVFGLAEAALACHRRLLLCGTFCRRLPAVIGTARRRICVAAGF